MTWQALWNMARLIESPSFSQIRETKTMDGEFFQLDPDLVLENLPCLKRSKKKISNRHIFCVP